LVLDVASKFGNTVYKITNAKDLQALYVNPLSNFRDLEYEVLVNVGYQMKVGKPLYKYKKFNGQDITVYEAKLVPNKNFKDFQKLDFSMKDIYIKDIYHDLISKSEVQSKSIVTVAYDVLTIGFESYRGKTDFTINISFKANKFSIYEENTDEGTRQLVGHYPYKEESKKELYKYLKGVYDKADSASKNNNLLLYTQMARKFTDEGFIVKLENIKSVGFHLILTGDDDDHIALHFDTYMKDNKYGICVKAKSNNIKINKSREFESIDMVVNSIYSLVVKTFKLNSANRADKVISLIAMYRGTTYKKQMIEPTLIMYTVDGVDIQARLSGTDIEYTIASQSLITSHFDNITKVASSVYTLGKTLGEFK
jgi:hypothetical protein